MITLTYFTYKVTQPSNILYSYWVSSWNNNVISNVTSLVSSYWHTRVLHRIGKWNQYAKLDFIFVSRHRQQRPARNFFLVHLKGILCLCKSLAMVNVNKGMFGMIATNLYLFVGAVFNGGILRNLLFTWSCKYHLNCIMGRANNETNWPKELVCWFMIIHSTRSYQTLYSYWISRCFD